MPPLYPTPLYAIPVNDFPQSKHHPAWKLLLLLPYLGLCFPQLYNRASPELFGFPFFYWYQLASVLVTAALLGFVYRKLSR
jgi:hypothetical protein